MGDLRARDLGVGYSDGMTELRCPEEGCGRLLIRFQQARGSSLVETFCRNCGTKAVWRFEEGRRPVYTVMARRI